MQNILNIVHRKSAKRVCRVLLFDFFLTASLTLSLPSAITVPGSLTVTGNFNVLGTQTVVDSTTIEVTNSFTFEGTTSDDFETT